MAMPRPRFSILLFVLLGLLSGVYAQTLSRPQLKTALDKLTGSSLVKNASVAISIYDPMDKSSIYEYHSTTSMIPASVQKIYTAVTSMEVLGLDYRFQTHIGYSGEVVDGVLKGNLIIRGGGDPSWVEEIYPDGPHKVFEAWADSLKAHGITSIDGDLVADLSLYPTQVYLGQWVSEDKPYNYAPSISALSFNANTIRYDMLPASSAGKPVIISPRFGYEYFYWKNQAKTTKKGGGTSVWLQTAADSRNIVFKGSVAIGSDDYLKPAVRDPAGFTLKIIAETLKASGIGISGNNIVQDKLSAPLEAIPLFTYYSVELTKILAVMLKTSSNMIAEALLCTLGGSAEGGSKHVSALLKELGFPEDKVAVKDGSGLARSNQITSAQLCALLCHAHDQEWFPTFVSSLAMPGENGTLKKRFKGNSGEPRVFAKTGTMKGVSCLAGYVRAADDQLYAFVILCNKVSSVANARKWQESICNLLMQYNGQ
jgi:D-alanyl-D-alanine carboxypeptidase/D-alanyl-D-alanine-endopeptidase (penicillin-binding protein 4)